jgi:hypothetical protein
MLSQLPSDVISRHPVLSYRVTESERKLLNEINSVHSDFYFGSDRFTEEDMVLKMSDAKEFFTFLNLSFHNIVPLVVPNVSQHSQLFPAHSAHLIVSSPPMPATCASLAVPAFNEVATVATATKLSTEEKTTASAAAPLAERPFPVRLIPLTEYSVVEGREAPPYRLQKANVQQRVITCINARPHDFSIKELMMTFPEFIRYWCPGLAVEGVLQFLQTKLSIPIYQGNR